MVLTFSSECHRIKRTGKLTEGRGPRVYLNTSVVTQLVPSEVHRLRKVRVGQVNSAGKIFLTGMRSSLLFTLEMLRTTVSIPYYLIITDCL